MNNDQIIDWLLKGDVALQYQVKRDLFNGDDSALQDRISREGWGKKLLSKRQSHGHWGQQFYQPKWISSHYSLLDLRNLSISSNNQIIREVISRILDEEKGTDGGMLPHGKFRISDICVGGMVLNYASYFKVDQERLESIVDLLLKEQVADGGFNCQSNRQKVKHSSLHSTLSILEGISEYEKNGYTYRLKELVKAKESAIEFILVHRLFLSDRTGKVIQKEFLKLTYPYRWKYNILRAMDYFRYAGVEWDDRMQDAIDYLKKKRKKDGTWNVRSKHAGQVHFEMEKAGKSSRWITLHALRVFDFYNVLD